MTVPRHVTDRNTEKMRNTFLAQCYAITTYSKELQAIGKYLFPEKIKINM